MEGETMTATAKGLAKAAGVTVLGAALAQIEPDVWAGEDADETIAYVVIRDPRAARHERWRGEMYAARTQASGAQSWHHVVSATAPTQEGVETALRIALHARIQAVAS